MEIIAIILCFILSHQLGKINKMLKLIAEQNQPKPQPESVNLCLMPEVQL